VDDSFNFGEPAKHGAGSRVAKAPSRTKPLTAAQAPAVVGGTGGPAKIVIGVIALVVGAVLVVGFLMFSGSSGKQIAQDQATAVAQIDKTKDALAQSNAQSAIYAAKGTMAASGSYSGVDAAAMKAAEPSFTYTDGPSTGSMVVSVASNDTSIALAVLADSGTCYFVKDTVGAGTTYGSATGSCIGSAAMTGATAAAW